MARIYDLAGGERDIVPGVGGKERIGLRHANADEESEGGRGSQSFTDLLQTAAQRPEFFEVRRVRARSLTDDDAELVHHDLRARLRHLANIHNHIDHITTT